MAVAAGADAVGFVGARPPSPRTIPDKQIADIIGTIPPPVATVLLTTERTAAAIESQVRSCRPSTVQITQHLDIAQAKRVAELLPDVRRIQVIHVDGAESLNLIARYAPYSHAFLLDSGKPGASELGGTGRVHDWSISARFVAQSPIPVFLAGGLTADNAASAMQKVRPFGLDLCTGIRTDGRLDPAKLTAFMSALRRQDWAIRGDG